MFIKWLLLPAVLCFASSMAMACEGGCKDGQCKLKKKDMSALLGLDGVRADQLRALEKQHKGEKKALRDEHRSQKQALREKHEGELSALLSTEEQARLKPLTAHGSQHKHDKPHSCKDGQCPHKKGRHHH